MQRIRNSGRLEDFALDSPEPCFRFQAGWPRRTTGRRLHSTRHCEYKRFAFLAVAAGHPVSPSEAVDQPGLHLTYTENYWKSSA